MSVIRVDNFGPSAGGTTYSAGGIAKAFAYWTYSGGTPTASDSLNVSSFNDVGTGQTGANYTNAFDQAAKTSGGMAQINTRVICKWAASQTTSYDLFYVYEITGTPATNDSEGAFITHGDLA